jgi:hypothetical protein
LGLGFSSAFSLSRSSYPEWLQNPLGPCLIPDAGLGYFFGKVNAEVRLSYRRMGGYASAYGLTQAYARRSIALELMKFKGNYHGFIPFLGLGISHEWLKYTEEDEVTANSIRIAKETNAPVVVAGWDIRPTKAEFFILRTNLRYTPLLSLKSAERKISLDQLEVNFIQLVVFPQRITTYRKYKNEI